MTSTTLPTPSLVELGERRMLMIDGAGAPEAPAFGAAVLALYAVHGNPSAPLEGLWTSDDDDGFSLDHPERWRWTLLLEAPAGLAAGDALPPGVRIESFEEGRAAEVLHVGPYAGEAPSIARLDAFIAAEGLVARGRHHEIYLDDPAACPPERLRTIVRQPVG